MPFLFFQEIHTKQQTFLQLIICSLKIIKGHTKKCFLQNYKYPDVCFRKNRNLNNVLRNFGSQETLRNLKTAKTASYEAHQKYVKISVNWQLTRKYVKLCRNNEQKKSLHDFRFEAKQCHILFVVCLILTHFMFQLFRLRFQK